MLPRMIFKTDEVDTLESFVERLNSHSVATASLHLEIPILPEPAGQSSFTEWEEFGVCEHAAASQSRAREFVEKWLQIIDELGPSSEVYLPFNHFWRDLRALRSVFVQ